MASGQRFRPLSDQDLNWGGGGSFRCRRLLDHSRSASHGLEEMLRFGQQDLDAGRACRRPAPSPDLPAGWPPATGPRSRTRARLAECSTRFSVHRPPLGWHGAIFPIYEKIMRYKRMMAIMRQDGHFGNRRQGAKRRTWRERNAAGIALTAFAMSPAPSPSQALHGQLPPATPSIRTTCRSAS